MHAYILPPVHPLGDGPGEGPMAGALQWAGELVGHVYPLASQHGGDFLSSSGHSTSS